MSGALLTLAALAVLGSGVSQAAPPPPARRDMLELASQIKETKEVLVESETERRRLLGSLYAINQRMKKIAGDKGKLTDELLQAQDSVNGVASAIHSLEDQIQKQRGALKRRVRALYKLSGESFIGVLFSQGNAYEFDSTMRNLKIVSDNDYQLIRSYRDNLKSLAAQRGKLKSQVERLLVLERRMRKHEELLKQEHHAKSELAQQFESTTKLKMQEIKSLRRKTTMLSKSGTDGARGDEATDNQIAMLLQPSIFEKKGALPAPVAAGTISKDFGLIVDPVYRFKMSHKGWQIRVTPLTVVSAIDAGDVVFAGALDGYGRTVIVDHGDHYYSVYGWLDDVGVTTGDRLRSGGAIGKSNRQLYFEIRHFSEPENPNQWMSEKNAILAKNNVISSTQQQARADQSTSPRKTN